MVPCSIFGHKCSGKNELKSCPRGNFGVGVLSISRSCFTGRSIPSAIALNSSMSSPTWSRRALIERALRSPCLISGQHTPRGFGIFALIQRNRTQRPVNRTAWATGAIVASTRRERPADWRHAPSAQQAQQRGPRQIVRPTLRNDRRPRSPPARRREKARDCPVHGQCVHPAIRCQADWQDQTQTPR